MKKYWLDVPSFRYVKHAERCASRIKEYFQVKVRVLKKEDCGDSALEQSLARMIAVAAALDPDDLNKTYDDVVPYPTWYVFFETDDKEKGHMIECFIVAWALGCSDRAEFDLNI